MTISLLFLIIEVEELSLGKMHFGGNIMNLGGMRLAWNRISVRWSSSKQYQCSTAQDRSEPVLHWLEVTSCLLYELKGGRAYEEPRWIGPIC